MIIRASLAIIPALGASIVLRGHLIPLFLGLLCFLVLLDMIDTLTKMRVRRLEGKVESKKMRAGVSQKMSEYAILLLIAVVIYFILGQLMGQVRDCTTIGIFASAIPTVTTLMFIIGAFISILENNVEYCRVKEIEPNRVVFFLIRFFGVLQLRLENKVLEKVSKPQQTKETQ